MNESIRSNLNRLVEAGKRKSRAYMKKALKLAERATIELRPDMPKTLEEYIELERNAPFLGRTINCFWRHELTNYDEICGNIRKQIGTVPDECKAILQKKVDRAVGGYLQTIGYFDSSLSWCGFRRVGHGLRNVTRKKKLGGQYAARTQER